MMDEPEIEAAVLQRERDELTRALGMDPSVLVWPTKAIDPDAGTVESDGAPPAVSALIDEEWDALLSTGLLPPEASQAQSLSNRDVIDAVLMTAGRRKPWTSLATSAVASPEAVRKKFARMAAKGIWQQIAAIVDTLKLSPARTTELRIAGRHAAGLAREQVRARARSQ